MPGRWGVLHEDQTSLAPFTSQAHGLTVVSMGSGFGHFPVAQVQGLELEVILTGGQEGHWAGVCRQEFEP